MRQHDAVTEKVIAEKPIEKIKDKPFISITEAALYMGVSRPTIYLYLRNGEISAKRMGSKYLIAREDIENLFNHPDKFEPVRNERKAITEFYTTQEILKRYEYQTTLKNVKTILNKLGGPRLTTGRFLGFWIALFASVFAMTSCSDDLDVRQSYPFTVDVMPYGDKIVKGQTMELRFEIKPEGNYTNTLYTIRCTIIYTLNRVV